MGNDLYIANLSLAHDQRETVLINSGYQDSCLTCHPVLIQLATLIQCYIVSLFLLPTGHCVPTYNTSCRDERGKKRKCLNKLLGSFENNEA